MRSLSDVGRDVTHITPRSSARLELAIGGAGFVLAVFALGIAYDVAGAGTIAACVALARGRTWGLFVVGVAAVYVLSWGMGSQMPTYWTNGGCISSGHPATYNPALSWAFTVALAPWIGPVIRQLRGSSRQVAS